MGLGPSPEYNLVSCVFKDEHEDSSNTGPGAQRVSSLPLVVMMLTRPFFSPISVR